MTAARSPSTDVDSLVSPADVRRFGKAATVRDEGAFLRELDRFVREKIAEAEKSVGPAAEVLRRKAAALRAATSWQPSTADIQRGRVELLREFDRPHNLPIADFARLAHKSRQQIYKDMAAGRLLALDVGRRGRRLPDWQLESAPLRLTQAVLGACASRVDVWTVYRVLMTAHDALDRRSPVQAVTPGTIDAVTRVVLGALGLRVAKAGRARAPT